MAINPYGFKDNVTGIILIVRAESEKEAQIIFDEYIVLLNENVLTDFQVKKEIPPGTLRASGFDLQGVVNGGVLTEEEITPAIVPKALYINGAANSYASTPSAAANTPGGAFIMICNAKSNNWSLEGAGQTLLAKFDAGTGTANTSYLVEADFSTSALLVSDFTADTLASGALTFFPFVGITDTSSIWTRVDWDGSGEVNHYMSLQTPAVAYQNINWTLLGTNNVTPFVLNPGDDIVTSGAAGGVKSVSFNPFDGVIYRALLIGGTDPTADPQMDMNPSDYIEGSSWTADGTLEVWTLTGDAQIAPYLPSDGDI